MKKMFDEKIEDYQKPLDRPAKNIPIEKTSNQKIKHGDIYIDIPEEFIPISSPSGKMSVGYEMSVGYLSVENTPLINKSYLEFFNILKEINRQTGENYRFPIFPELYNAYHFSDNEDFRKSCKEYSEYTADIIFDGKTLLRDPTNIEFNAGIKIKGKILTIDIELPEAWGHVKKWDKYGLPKELMDGIKLPPHPVTYYGTCAGYAPVIRKYSNIHGNLCFEITWPIGGIFDYASARLVKEG